MQRMPALQPLRRVFQRPHFSLRRPYSTRTPPSARLDRVLSRLPPSVQRYTNRLKDAPVSHAVAFLFLHELTAIVPLFGLFGLFHYLADNNNNPVLTYMAEHYGEQVAGGVARFERYFRKKGWLEEGDDAASTTAEPAEPAVPATPVLARWADARYRIVVEVGLAYAITKLLLPVRIAASLSATPWFAGVLQNLRRTLRR